MYLFIGGFEHSFTVPGTYFYWSGYVDPDETVYFRGTVHVLPLPSHSEKVIIMQNGVEAVYKKGNSFIRHLQ